MDAKDVTYNEAPAGILTSMEIKIGIVTASLPTVYAGLQQRTQGACGYSSKHPYGYKTKYPYDHQGSGNSSKRQHNYDAYALERRGPSRQTLIPVEGGDYGIDTTIVAGSPRWDQRALSRDRLHDEIKVTRGFSARTENIENKV